MKYIDFDIRIGERTEKGDYPVVSRSTLSGEARSTVRLELDELALENRLQAIKIALLQSGGTHRDVSFSSEQRSVQSFGKELFDAVMVDELRGGYRVARRQALKDGIGLRLRMNIEAPELASLPWEFLYDDSEGDYVSLSAETPVIRYMELERPTPPLIIEPPLRLLVMIASPIDTAALDTDRERQRMERALAPLVASGRLMVEWMEGQTWRDLQRALRNGPWHVFHFIGHGAFDRHDNEGQVLFADENGRSYRCPATKLGRLLADHKHLRLAVLNACSGATGSDTDIFSSTSAVLMRRGLPAVVAMQFAISDRAAIEFTGTFYEAISDGMPVDTGLAEARKAMSMCSTNTVEWSTPVLHMRSADGVLFDVEPQTVATARVPDTNVASHTKKSGDALGRSRVGVLAAAGLVLAALIAWLLVDGSEPTVIATQAANEETPAANEETPVPASMPEVAPAVVPTDGLVGEWLFDELRQSETSAERKSKQVRNTAMGAVGAQTMADNWSDLDGSVSQTISRGGGGCIGLVPDRLGINAALAFHQWHSGFLSCGGPTEAESLRIPGRKGRKVGASYDHAPRLPLSRSFSYALWIRPVEGNATNQWIAGSAEYDGKNPWASLKYGVSLDGREDYGVTLVLEAARGAPLVVTDPQKLTRNANTGLFDWTFYVATVDSKNNTTVATLYRNGKRVADKTGSGNYSNPTAAKATSQKFWIGGVDRESDYVFRGGIDDVRVYDRALTPKEVAVIYNDKSP